MSGGLRCDGLRPGGLSFDGPPGRLRWRSQAPPATFEDAPLQPVCRSSPPREARPHPTLQWSQSDRRLHAVRSGGLPCSEYGTASSAFNGCQVEACRSLGLRSPNLSGDLALGDLPPFPEGFSDGSSLPARSGRSPRPPASRLARSPQPGRCQSVERWYRCTLTYCGAAAWLAPWLSSENGLEALGASAGSSGRSTGCCRARWW